MRIISLSVLYTLVACAKPALTPKIVENHGASVAVASDPSFEGNLAATVGVRLMGTEKGQRAGFVLYGVVVAPNYVITSDIGSDIFKFRYTGQAEIIARDSVYDDDDPRTPLFGAEIVEQRGSIILLRTDAPLPNAPATLARRDLEDGMHDVYHPIAGKHGDKIVVRYGRATGVRPNEEPARESEMSLLTDFRYISTGSGIYDARDRLVGLGSYGAARVVFWRMASWGPRRVSVYYERVVAVSEIRALLDRHGVPYRVLH